MASDATETCADCGRMMTDVGLRNDPQLPLALCTGGRDCRVYRAGQAAAFREVVSAIKADGDHYIAESFDILADYCSGRAEEVSGG